MKCATQWYTGKIKKSVSNSVVQDYRHVAETNFKFSGLTHSLSICCTVSEGNLNYFLAIILVTNHSPSYDNYIYFSRTEKNKQQLCTTSSILWSFPAGPFLS